MKKLIYLACDSCAEFTTRHDKLHSDLQCQINYLSLYNEFISNGKLKKYLTGWKLQFLHSFCEINSSKKRIKACRFSFVTTWWIVMPIRRCDGNVSYLVWVTNFHMLTPWEESSILISNLIALLAETNNHSNQTACRWIGCHHYQASKIPQGPGKAHTSASHCPHMGYTNGTHGLLLPCGPFMVRIWTGDGNLFSYGAYSLPWWGLECPQWPLVDKPWCGAWEVVISVSIWPMCYPSGICCWISH